ncbi:MAG TPA: DUF3426 domain-containing protein [Methylotenera sp.]|nr:DUF3426 domain-containing protein [Methylotenera sp.]
MSNITLCPNCQTQFVVTKKQLKQYQGKVRCGHCLHVFDATLHMVETPPMDSMADAEQEALPLTTDNGQPLDASASAVDAVSASFQDQEDIATTPPDDGNAWPTIIDDIEHEVSQAAISTPITINSPAEPTIADIAAVADDDTITEVIDYSALAPSFSEVPLEPETVFETPKPISNLSVDAKFYKKRPPRSRASTWLLFCVALVLALTAIGQSAYFLRNEIPIYYPNIKPYLVSACEKIGCEITLPKKIEYIFIDDFEIEEDAEYVGLMRLTSTLINQAGFAQTYPNLELTLKDADDNPKLRRTLKPAEYLPQNTAIENGIGPGEQVKIKLNITTNGEEVAGYSALVTY